MRIQFAGLMVGHPDRRGEVLAKSGHSEGQNVDSGVGLAVKAQRTGNSACGVLSLPRTRPGADTLFQIYHDLFSDAAVNVFSFGMFCIVFSFKTNFFLRETRDGLKAFSDADMSRAQPYRVHRRPLTGSTAGITAVVKARVEWGKKWRENDFARTPNV
jgi:hypothetical protein